MPAAPSSDRAVPTPGRRRWPSATTVLRVLGILGVAAILRPPVAGIGPVLPDLRAELGLSGTMLAVLTALPVLCFGSGAFAGTAVARRFGLERAVALLLVVVVAGLSLRVLGATLALYLGTVLAGLAIAVANVLLPAIIKADFPRSVGAMTGVYSTVLTGSAALAALLAVPLAEGSGYGWRGSLGFWALVGALALALWVPQLLGTPAHQAQVRPPAAAGGLLRSRLAWGVTGFMALQSLGFYALLAWLPSLLRDAGFSPARAGALLSLTSAVGIPLGLVLPGLAARAADQRLTTMAITVLTGLGLGGLALAPQAAPVLWVVLIGLGQGAAFPLALTLIALRASTPQVTGRLSAMAQGIGYLIAAGGTFLVGAVHDVAGTWGPAVGLLLASLVVQAVAGWIAGRAGVVA